MEKEVKREQEIAWHSLSFEEIIQKLGSDKQGLGNEEAKLRLEKYGKNELKREDKIRPLIIFISQFNSFFIFLLIFAAIITALVSEWVDFFVIMAIVILNAVIGFLQNYRAENSIRELKKVLVPKAKVLRQGILSEILASEVVPGDILVLQEGDKVIADARLIEIHEIQLNEAILTGESVPAGKFIKKLKIDVSLADRENIIYSGTTVVRGNGKAIVFATGMNTEFGKIASMVQKIKHEKTPLQKKIDNFAKKIGIIVIAISVFIALIGISLGMDKFQIFLTSVSLAVAAVPEGLPAVITVCLAIAVQRMFKKKSLIRTLPSAETLGRVTVICTDKTGTITGEEMTVTEIFYNNKVIELEKLKGHRDETLKLLLKVNCLCNNARAEKLNGGIHLMGDPTEKALLKAALECGLNKKELSEKEPKVKEFSFSSARKMMSIVRQNNKLTSYVKGAPDIIINKCSKELVFGKVHALSENRKREIIRVYEEMASQGLRVLGFAFKEIDIPLDKAKKIKQKDAEEDLIFVGLQGMMDPPRPEVKEAIAACEKAGISVKMITGDSLLTAKAVARKIGLVGEAVNVDELEKMSDADLASRIKKIAIFARVGPEHKLRIVNFLKKRKEIVAVTGDGVNDAPALRAADIGIAMGIRGSDVARETSNIILVDDNFASIVNGIKEGRVVYENIKKFTKFLLGVNFSQLILVFYSIVLRLPLMLLPLQILWMNLVADSIPALALSVEKEEEIMKKKPIKDGSILEGILLFIIVSGIIAVIAGLIAFYFGLLSHYDIERTRTLVVTTLILFEMFFIFACRSNKPVHKIGIFSNKFLVGAVVVSTLVHILLVYSPVASAFGLVTLSITDWILAFGLGITGLVLFEIGKIIKEKRLEKLKKLKK